MTWLSWLGRRFTSARALCVVLLLALLFFRVTDPLPLEELRLRTFDIFQVIKPRVAKLRPAVIVDIDEASLRKLGQWPWPRTRVADLITSLTKLGAAAIAFDVVFSEPDRLSPASLAAASSPSTCGATRSTSPAGSSQLPCPVGCTSRKPSPPIAIACRSQLRLRSSRCNSCCGR